MSSRLGLALAAASLWAAAIRAEDWVKTGELLRQRLYERTAVVLTGLEAPLVLVRHQPQLGVNAREYVHVAPLEINRQGELRYYLWLSVLRTVAHEPAAAVRHRFEHVYLYADGEPLELFATSSTLADRGLDNAFYASRVRGAVEVWYAVTADQLRWLGAAKEVQMACGLDPDLQYEAWDWDPRGLTAFADYSRDRELR
jgi:hypothetical protein